MQIEQNIKHAEVADWDTDHATRNISIVMTTEEVTDSILTPEASYEHLMPEMVPEDLAISSKEAVENGWITEAEQGSLIKALGLLECVEPYVDTYSGGLTMYSNAFLMDYEHSYLVVWLEGGITNLNEGIRHTKCEKLWVDRSILRFDATDQHAPTNLEAISRKIHRRESIGQRKCRIEVVGWTKDGRRIELPKPPTD